MKKTRPPTTVEEAERITKAISDAEAKGELPPPADWSRLEMEEILKGLREREDRKRGTKR